MAGEAEADPLVGELLENRYRVIRYLDAGTMGRVYAGMDLALDRPIALKVLYAGDASVRARFIAEARALASINHANVVNVYSRGILERDKTPYIVLEFVNGLSLEKFQEAHGTVFVDALPHLTNATTVRAFSLDAALTIFRQICSGLRAVHKLRMIHRDVKPQNIKVDPRGCRVKILDFGIAKTQPECSEATVLDMDLGVAEALGARQTQAGTVLGTSPYMEPSRQLLGYTVESTDYHVDTYAAAVILYEMLAGRLPYEDSEPMLKYARTTDWDAYHAAWITVHGEKHPLTPIHTIRPDVPPQLSAFFNRALGRDPAKRFQTIDALEESLESCLRRTDPPPPPSVFTQTPTWALLMVGAATFVLLVAVAFAITRTGGQRAQPTNAVLRDTRPLPIRPISILDTAPPENTNTPAPASSEEDASTPTATADAAVSSEPSSERRSHRRSRHATPCGGLLPNGTVRICL